jgi:predicted acylesterase/phospholipase RssA
MAEQGGTALILSGAVAKGAFEAGALEVLSEHLSSPTRVSSLGHIRSVMGTSAGALNAALYAAGIRGGMETLAARRMVDLWEEHGQASEAFTLSPRGIVTGKGLATADRVLEILLSATRELALGTAGGREVDLRLVVAPLAGTLDPDSGATTFELPLHFGGEVFDTEEGRRSICDAAVASAAFPLAYVPKELPQGPCIDGGIVNNTPVKHAISGAGSAGISSVIVVVPHPPRYEASPGSFSDYIGHLLTIVVQERLYRDLRYAARVNQRLKTLAGLVESGVLSDDQAEAVRRALGWKPLVIIQIRPDEPLPGNAFAAFWDKDLRREYVRMGREAAEKAIAKLRAG